MRTRSKTKRTRENLNRLPREVEATLPSWVKCTDPISAETLEEVRRAVLVWIKNVRNYVEETDLKHAPPHLPSWNRNVFFVEIPLVWHLLGAVPDLPAPGSAVGANDNLPHFEIDANNLKELPKKWSRFIRQMILSDNIVQRTELEEHGDTEITLSVGPDRHWSLPYSFDNYKLFPAEDVVAVLVVTFDSTGVDLSSEIKDEICFKLESAVRALKSRISRICGINELERRTQSH